MASDSSRDRLPFEPGKKRKKSAKSEQTSANRRPASSDKTEGDRAVKPKAASTAAKQSAAQTPVKREPIPEAVSRRMIARIGAFSGTPTIFGVLSLVGSYFVVTREWFPLPSIAVLLVSMGFFGLGVLGVTYGALSASWDEADEGTPLGWKEFKINLARVRESFRSAGQND